MKKFMKTCYKCKTNVKEATVVKDGIKLKCLKCPKCGEEYFTSSELIRYDILTGKRRLVRKFGTLGVSQIIRVPDKVIKDFKIKPGDYGIFEERPDGILIKPLHANELNP
ncbi:AbrB/MazE/SpoVT family DNA-binding domain-containing protein [Candidatus Woesearchaeota archaeon]|nr:AbrB/MazE/SpoVT family DNA-binding domain-containing protein [Candidatus Woesearchaeota archaeon]